jgi:hypothetical protein
MWSRASGLAVALQGGGTLYDNVRDALSWGGRSRDSVWEPQRRGSHSAWTGVTSSAGTYTALSKGVSYKHKASNFETES